MLIPVPPRPVQESIAEAIDSVTQTIANLAIEIGAAKRVKDSMLQNLLTGKSAEAKNA